MSDLAPQRRSIVAVGLQLALIAVMVFVAVAAISSRHSEKGDQKAQEEMVAPESERLASELKRTNSSAMAGAPARPPIKARQSTRARTH